MSPAQPCWIDGELVADLAAVHGDDRALSAISQGRGCYTTARIRAGRPRWPERHAERLVRDASRLGIGRLDPALVVRALFETANSAFGPHDGAGARGTEGIVRVQASRTAAARVRLVAEPRPLGDDPPFWRACTAPFPHEGPMPWSGAKVSNHLLFELARDFSHAQGVEEALLFDRDGYLVEGARSSLVVVDRTGQLSTPDPRRGGVASIARQRLQELLPELTVRNVAVGELQRAQELIAINAVRGARSCVQLDGKSIGNGRPGRWSKRIGCLLGDESAGVSRTRAS